MVQCSCSCCNSTKAPEDDLQKSVRCVGVIEFIESRSRMMIIPFTHDGETLQTQMVDTSAESFHFLRKGMIVAENQGSGD